MILIKNVRLTALAKRSINVKIMLMLFNLISVDVLKRNLMNSQVTFKYNLNFILERLNEKKTTTSGF
jgi:hypothetical protein